MSIENFNNKPKTAENPHGDKVPSNNLNDIGRNIEQRGEKGAAPSSQSKTDSDNQHDQQNKDIQPDGYSKLSDKDRGQYDRYKKAAQKYPNDSKEANGYNGEAEKLLNPEQSKSSISPEHRDKLNSIKNQQEPSQAQTEKNNLKGDYGQKKSGSDTQDPKLQEQSPVNNELPRTTIPQEKYNQRQELLDRLCPHRTQKSESSPPEETPSNRF